MQHERNSATDALASSRLSPTGIPLDVIEGCAKAYYTVDREDTIGLVKAEYRKVATIVLETARSMVMEPEMKRLRAVAERAAALGLGFFNDGTGDHDEYFSVARSTHVTFHPPPGYAMHVRLTPGAYADNARLFDISKALRDALAELTEPLGGGS